MPNILVTEKCVRACPYCFAKEHMKDAASDAQLSWEDLIYIADFFWAAKEMRLSLLGGEPFLHPYLVDFIFYLVERGFHVNVFTSGILSPARLEDARRVLSGIPTETMSFVCNMNAPDITPPAELERTEAFLAAFGEYTTPGYNIYKPDFRLDHIIESIVRFGMRRHIRIGLTNPIPGEINRYLALNDMRAMADRFMSYLPVFERLRVVPGFDCGLPLCLFTDEEVGKLFKLNHGQLKFNCGPALDIGPDLRVWACFPLARYNNRSLYDFNSPKELHDFYVALHGKIRDEIGGIYERCDQCAHRENRLCSGGCLAHTAAAFRNEERVRFSGAYE
jgi:hypothetical protein